jgi:hypothetical protein
MIILMVYDDWDAIKDYWSTKPTNYNVPHCAGNRTHNFFQAQLVWGLIPFTTYPPSAAGLQEFISMASQGSLLKML